jgi:15-cis-phytoene synthase
VSTASLEAQLHKLRTRRPELGLASVFMPAQQRALHWHWLALVEEIEEACFELSESYVAQVKLGWWAEELGRGHAGQGRHPLVQALFEQARAGALPASDWTALAQAGQYVLERELTPADSARAQAALSPLAAAIDVLERGLFGGAEAQPAIASELLLRRLLRARGGHHAQARMPRNLLARHALAPSHLAAGSAEPEAERAFLRDYAQELQTMARHSRAGLARPRALATTIAEWRLQRLIGGEIEPRPSGFGLTLALWRAARRSAPMPDR